MNRNTIIAPLLLYKISFTHHICTMINSQQQQPTTTTTTNEESMQCYLIVTRWVKTASEEVLNKKLLVKVEKRDETADSRATRRLEEMPGTKSYTSHLHSVRKEGGKNKQNLYIQYTIATYTALW